MNVQPYHQYPDHKICLYPFLSRWLLLLFIFIPLSCSAQKNALTHISSVKRNDGKGYVIRFHLNHTVSSFDFSQPTPYLLQLELKGSNIDTANINLHDKHQLIKETKYYKIKDGIGVNIFLTGDAIFKAKAYPDGASDDILVGLTKTSKEKLASYIKSMKPFSWSDVPINNLPIGKKKQLTNTPYHQIRKKIRFDTVVLDPGHGGFDTGAIGYHGIYEKNIVLAIAKKVGHYIHKYMPGVKVVYTRDTDKFVGLKERGRIANRANGDLFVCIHANSARSPRAHGTETYFLGLERRNTALQVMERENNVVRTKKSRSNKKISKQQLVIYELANSGYIANSEKLAGMLHQQFKDRAMRIARGIKQARFVVLYHASMPAVLVETGFITNPKEAKYLTSDYGQSIIASAIFRAIRDYKEQFDKSQHFTDNQ